jgi:energy-coupling factor transporter ATP-binding protein EcfA2
VKSAAKKTECGDEHTEQSGDAVIDGKDIPETPGEQNAVPETPGESNEHPKTRGERNEHPETLGEQTVTFQAIQAGDDDPRFAETAGGSDTSASDRPHAASAPADETSGRSKETPAPEATDPADHGDAPTGEAEIGDADTGHDETGSAQTGGAQTDTAVTGAAESTQADAGETAFDAFAPIKPSKPSKTAKPSKTVKAVKAPRPVKPSDPSKLTKPSGAGQAQAAEVADSGAFTDGPSNVPAAGDEEANGSSAEPPGASSVSEGSRSGAEEAPSPAGPTDLSSPTGVASPEMPDDPSEMPDDPSPAGDGLADSQHDDERAPGDGPADAQDDLPAPADVTDEPPQVSSAQEKISFDPFKETKAPIAPGRRQAGPGDAGSRGVWEPVSPGPAGQFVPGPDPGGDAGASDDAEAGSDASLRRVREMPLPKPVSRALTAALAGLRDSVTGLRLGLDVPGVEEARKAQADILAQIEDYVIPRVHMSTAPALIVIAGSTGAGKSTLVNTLAAAKVSSTGVRRPTTGTPVLACHPDDRDWFAKGDVLTGMTRVDRPGTDGTLDNLVLAASERLPQGVGLLDTPDIDSVVESHHEVAHRMLDAADLWVFVTTATRYADAPAWNLLRLAKERGARMAIVLSRVPVKSREVIDKHFHRMLQEYGLGDVERFVVNESTVTGGRLPEAEIAELRMWLTELSVDEQRRAQAVQDTLDGVLNSFRSRIPALARHLEAQVAFRAELRTDVDAAYMGALAEIDEATSDGSLLRGEVLARWQDFAGSGDLMKTLHLRRPGRLATKTSQQAPARLRAFKSALRSGLESVIVSSGQRAAEEVVVRWRQRDGVGDSLAATPGLGRPSDEFVRRVGRTIGAWQEHVVGLIRSGGVTKRSVSKLVSFDEEALALVFMIGLLGYGSSDVAASSGTGTLPERLLRGVLGAESLRNTGMKARSDLRARVSVLFDEETFKYVQVLDEAGIPDEAAAKRLYQATYNLEVAR